MAGLYRSPLRVYLLLAILSLVGIFSANRLPVSLFPNSAKPDIRLCFGLTLAPSTFLRSFGKQMEEQLRTIQRGNLRVEKVTGNYEPTRACYEVEFAWGGDPEEALREVEVMANGFQGRLPKDSRDRMQVYQNNQNGGFFALSFYSPERSLNDVYNLLNPILIPRLSRVIDARNVYLNNPQQHQLLIELKPETMAAVGLLPSQVSTAILNVLASYSGGSFQTQGNSLRIEFPRAVNSIEDFRTLQIPTGRNKTVSLGDIARLDLTVPQSRLRIFKTSGTASVILFVSPKPGGNIKAMADDSKKAVDEILSTLPKDIQYKEIVNPSEFIQSAVQNVGREVAIAAGLAVFILFLFVGNLKNVATAAIEIPLSIVLAFIMMRLFGMNLNLISLGGLALSAGMNVDASVVVMENIFRHFEEHHGKTLDFETRLQIVVASVKEVQFSVIASTIASLVVFIPLAFTSDLSYAILGDLAKAVVFSHGFSAVVALILVPTIRLQLMKNGMTHDKPSLLERPLQKLEYVYGRGLEIFLDRAMIRWVSYGVLTLMLVILSVFVVPRLPREVVGKPDTEWLTLNVFTSGNSVIRQMETTAGQVENDLLTKFGDQIDYTFTQIYDSNASTIMMRMKDRSRANELWKKVEATFVNTPLTSYNVDSWNPAEMQIPDPPDFEISIHGPRTETMAETARDISDELRDRKIFPRVNVNPIASVEESLLVRPHVQLLPQLAQQGVSLSVADLADLTRTATEGSRIDEVDLHGEVMDMYMRFPPGYVNSTAELGALPIGVGSRIIPLKAVAGITREEVRPEIVRENGQELFYIRGRMGKGEEAGAQKAVTEATQLVEHWDALVKTRKAKIEADMAKADQAAGKSKAATSASERVSARADARDRKDAPSIHIEDSKKELTDAIRQLLFAVSLSIGLIFIVMVLQFGSLMNSLLVLVSVPLGFIGVILSLYIFRSTLSLNSLLGVILLNGVAVANSIILVDFLQKKVREGVAARIAAVEVARVRLRPILMTSMTTGLGMLPIALGLGEGGKILQPLGIAVAGGLAFSMTTTLFVVPALQVGWIEFQQRRHKRQAAAHDSLAPTVLSLALLFAFAGLAATCLSVTPAEARSNARNETSAMASSAANAAASSAANAPVTGKSAGEKAASQSAPSKSRDESGNPVEQQIKVSFSEAWQLILKRALRVEAQRAEVEISDWKKSASEGAFLPTLSAQAVENKGSAYAYSNPRVAQLSASVNLFRGGADLANLEASRKAHEAAIHKLGFERLATEEDAATALIQVIGKTQQRAINENLVKQQEDSLRVSQERFRQGFLARQETDKIQIDVDSARARLIDAQSAEAAARSQLEILLGSSNIKTEWPWRPALSSSSKLEDEKFDLDLRPDYRAALSTVESQRYLKNKAMAGLLPSIDLTASYGTYGTYDITDPSVRSYSTALTLTVPIFEGFKSYAIYKIQQSTLREALIQAETVRRTAPSEVANFRVSFQAARDTALAREKTAVLAEHLFEDNRQRFRMGRATANDLAIDQNRLLEAELLAVDGWVNAHLSLVKLCHSLGHSIDASGNCGANSKN